LRKPTPSVTTDFRKILGKDPPGDRRAVWELTAGRGEIVSARFTLLASRLPANGHLPTGVFEAVARLS
jgi:hypothetical protein